MVNRVLIAARKGRTDETHSLPWRGGEGRVGELRPVTPPSVKTARNRAVTAMHDSISEWELFVVAGTGALENWQNRTFPVGRRG